MSLWAVLIEIERPQKRWFREDTTQHSDLTQALDQLREWEVWFKDSTNVGSFLDFYDVPRWMTSRLQFRQHYVLIHGRRDEPSMNGLGKKRAAIEREGETLMTFDRLRPLEDLSDIITVVRDEHRYYAVHAQPTIDLNRFNVGDWRHVEGVEDVIAVDDRIADDRKDYLIEALHRGWAAMDKEDAERGRST